MTTQYPCLKDFQRHLMEERSQCDNHQTYLAAVSHANANKPSKDQDRPC